MLYRSASDTSVVTASPIAPRRSERLLALKKSKEASAVSLSESKPAIKEGTGGKGVCYQFGESSKTTVKSKKVYKETTNNTTGKTHDKQTTSKRLTKKSQSESDLVPKRKRRRTVSPEEDKPNDKTQKTSRTTGVTSANQLQSSSKKAKASASEPLLTSPKGKTSGGQDKGKRTTSSSRESKTSRKGKSSAGTSTSGVTTRQLRKLKGRNLTAEMSSDE